MKNVLFPPLTTGRSALALLVLRLVFGSAFMLHGSGKIIHAFSWMGPDAPVPGILQALAAFSEFGGGLAVILGLLTPLAALGLLFTMTVALLMVHIPAGHAFVAGSNHHQPTFELPMIYWAIALLLALTGPGVYSLDALLIQKKENLGRTPTPASV